MFIQRAEICYDVIDKIAANFLSATVVNIWSWVKVKILNGDFQGKDTLLNQKIGTRRSSYHSEQQIVLFKTNLNLALLFINKRYNLISPVVWGLEYIDSY